MRIAVTADLHLRESNPERLQNLEILVETLVSEGIGVLVIAGDLFDTADGSYGRLDALAERFQRMQLLIVPGNHDASLRPAMFGSANIQVFTQPTLKRIGGRLFLFLPYREGSTMGETITALRETERLKAHPWILVSHGDFSAPRPLQSGGERGYFPLTRDDLARFQPARAILGHIHAPNAVTESVVYPGSPYPVTSDEYGRRRVLILDTGSAAISELPLEHAPELVRAEIFLIPDGREQEQISAQLLRILEEPGSRSGKHGGERIVRVILKGYTGSRRGLKSFVEKVLAARSVRCGGVDLETLRISDEQRLAAVAQNVRQKVDRLELDYQGSEELRRTVLERALEMLYGA